MMRVVPLEFTTGAFAVGAAITVFPEAFALTGAADALTELVPVKNAAPTGITHFLLPW